MSSPGFYDDPDVPTVVDLYCGYGGVAYALKQLDDPVRVVGVDRHDYSAHYPGDDFILADAAFPRLPLRAMSADLVWASPPCTPYSPLSATYYGSAEAALEACPRYLAPWYPVREPANGVGWEWVIENVPRSTTVGDLDPDVRLNGLGFGRPYDLERHFETSFDAPNVVAPGRPDAPVNTRTDDDRTQAIAELAAAKRLPAEWGKQGVRSAIPREYVYWLLSHAPHLTDDYDVHIPRPDPVQPSLAAFHGGELA